MPGHDSVGLDMVTTEWHEHASGMPKPVRTLCWTWDYEYQRVCLAQWNGHNWEHWSTGVPVNVSHWAEIHVPAKPRSAW